MEEKQGLSELTERKELLDVEARLAEAEVDERFETDSEKCSEAGFNEMREAEVREFRSEGLREANNFKYYDRLCKAMVELRDFMNRCFVKK